MKEKIILFLFFLCGFTMAADAQKGLSVSGFFDGKVIPRSRMMETVVSGSRLSDFDLTFFRSIRFKATAEETGKIEAALNADARAAIQKENQRVSGRLVYSMMEMPPLKHQRRYLFFSNDAKDGQREVTLTYLEGRATLQSLKNLFKKQN